MNGQVLTMDSVVCRTSDVVFSRLDDELLAIDAQAGYCYSMNDTAGRIWELLNAPVSVAGICSRLQAEFTVEESSCQQEVLSLMERLLDSGLIQVMDAQKNPD